MKWNNLLSPDRIRGVKQRIGSEDLRTEFEKDYHRIIGSASFRRLQDKTQVFPLDKSDFIRPVYGCRCDRICSGSLILLFVGTIVKVSCCESLIFASDSYIYRKNLRYRNQM